MAKNNTPLSPDDGPPEPPSKSQRKRDMHALQSLGTQLITLPHEQYKRVILPENLRSAIDEARRIKDFEGLRRQTQFVGKLMRSVDLEALTQSLEKVQGLTTAANARFQRMERWREKLLADDKSMTAFMTTYPECDRQRLRQLVRNARQEQLAHKPPSALRELFQLIRQCQEHIETKTTNALPVDDTISKSDT